MAKRVVVLFHDEDELRPVEEAIVDMAGCEDATFHLVSTDDAEALVLEEMSPRRLRLMLLLAKLSDRMVVVTGEDASLTDRHQLREAIAQQRPDVLHVAGDPSRLQQALGQSQAVLPPLQPLPLPAPGAVV